MKIHIKATNLQLTHDLKNYIHKKIGSLSRFIKRMEDGGQLQMDIEVAQSTKHHKKGDIFYAEATMVVGKKILRANHYDKEIKIALNHVKDKMQVEIKKLKEKRFQNRISIKRFLGQ